LFCSRKALCSSPVAVRAANVDDVPVADHKASAFGVVGTEGLLETFQSAWDRLSSGETS
jgi:hypothetical protein